MGCLTLSDPHSDPHSGNKMTGGCALQYCRLITYCRGHHTLLCISASGLAIKNFRRASPVELQYNYKHMGYAYTGLATLLLACLILIQIQSPLEIKTFNFYVP